jgi:hypothetical protein
VLVRLEVAANHITIHSQHNSVLTGSFNSAYTNLYDPLETLPLMIALSWQRRGAWKSGNASLSSQSRKCHSPQTIAKAEARLMSVTSCRSGLRHGSSLVLRACSEGSKVSLKDATAGFPAFGETDQEKQIERLELCRVP